MYSSAIPGLSVFCDWLFLAFSGVSLETAANFLLFVKVVMILMEKPCQLWKLKWILFCNKNVSLFYFEGKRFQKKQIINDVEFSTIPKGYNFILKNNKNINSSFVSPIYTFSMTVNITVYIPLQSTNRKKYFNHIIYPGKMPTQAGNEHLSVHFIFHRPCLLYLSRKTFRVIIRRKWTLKWLFPLQHNKW